MDIHNNDISTAHHLYPERGNQSSDERNLIQLRRHDLISASKKQLSPYIFINETLIPSLKTILKAFRKIKVDHPNLVMGCSTFNAEFSLSGQ